MCWISTRAERLWSSCRLSLCIYCRIRNNRQKCVAAMEAFGAPYSVALLEMDNTGMYDTAAEDLGKVFVSTELGGGGTTTADTVSIAKRGVNNFLVHAGILTVEPTVHPTIHLDMPDKTLLCPPANHKAWWNHCVDFRGGSQRGRRIDAGARYQPNRTTAGGLPRGHRWDSAWAALPRLDQLRRLRRLSRCSGWSVGGLPPGRSIAAGAPLLQDVCF